MKRAKCFRSYPSVEASYQDHAEFLDSQPRYDSLFSYAPNDYKSWARGLKAAGYATAPDYAQRLIRIIEESKLYLLDREDGLTITERKPDTSPTTGSRPKQRRSSRSDRSGRVDPDDYRVTVNAHKGYNVYRTNGVNYILAHDGDTFEKISRDFRISARNLRKFNDVSKNAQPVAKRSDLHRPQEEALGRQRSAAHRARGRNPLVARTVLRHPHQIAGTSEQTQGRRCADSRYNDQDTIINPSI